MAFERFARLRDQVTVHIDEDLVELPDELHSLLLDVVADFAKLAFFVKLHVADLEVLVGLDLVVVFVDFRHLSVHSLDQLLIALEREFLEGFDKLVVFSLSRLDKSIVNLERKIRFDFELNAISTTSTVEVLEIKAR